MEPRDNDLGNLHPSLIAKFRLLAERLDIAFREGRTHSLFIPFEGFRGPRRQRQLLAEKPPVTKAGPWESAHAFGCAVDFVPYDERTRKFSWDENEDWDFLRDEAARLGLQRPIAWDKPHISAEGLFKAIRQAVHAYTNRE